MLLTRPPWLNNSWQKRDKIPPWIFPGIAESHAILHAAQPPIHGLFTGWQERDNPSMDF